MAITRTIVFMGCSITDAGHKDGDLGTGYAAMTAGMLTQLFPQVKFRFINSGVAGNCAYQCRDRWQTDVLDHHPDFVTLMIGGNDSYQFSIGDPNPELPVRAYRRTVDALVTRTLAQKPCRGMVLIPQHYLCNEAGRAANTFPTVGMIDAQPAYTRAMIAVGRKHGIPVIRSDKGLWAATRSIPAQQITPDFVHPNTFGHAIMAKHLVDALAPLIAASLPKKK